MLYLSLPLKPCRRTTWHRPIGLVLRLLPLATILGANAQGITLNNARYVGAMSITAANNNCQIINLPKGQQNPPPIAPTTFAPAAGQAGNMGVKLSKFAVQFNPVANANDTCSVNFEMAADVIVGAAGMTLPQLAAHVAGALGPLGLGANQNVSISLTVTAAGFTNLQGNPDNTVLPGQASVAYTVKDAQNANLAIDQMGAAGAAPKNMVPGRATGTVTGAGTVTLTSNANPARIETDFPDSFDAILCTYNCNSSSVGGDRGADTPLPSWAGWILSAGLMASLALAKTRNKRRF